VARETYEDAIDRGKPAVLHEESLRGVHVLSVANIPPGVEVEVRCEYVETLRRAGDRLTLRIPTTVGDIYGRAPLPPVDELMTGGGAPMGRISVIASDDEVMLHGRPMEGASARTPLNRPIDLSTALQAPRELVGRFADGSAVTLKLAPTAAADAPLDLAILIDRSGSMAVPCEAGRVGTKHQAVVAGLGVAALGLGAQDDIDLWQFNTGVESLGATDGPGLPHLLHRLAPPGGGTEIGAAIGAVLRGSHARDVLVVTDGLSHALDVQVLARSARRISVLLIGEDSLEAGIGRLAALTGGEIFVAAARELAATTETAMAVLRATPGSAPAAAGGDELSATRAGLDISAKWHVPSSAPVNEHLERAIGAFVAALRLPGLDVAAAVDLAVAEGLICHLTSLVLVDEAAKASSYLAPLRKVALPRPGVTISMAPPSTLVMADMAPSGRWPTIAREACAPQEPAIRRTSFLRRRPTLVERVKPGPRPPLTGAFRWSDWRTALVQGDLKPMPAPLQAEVERLAASASLVEIAGKIGLTPVRLVIAALATLSNDRYALRIARRILEGRDAGLLYQAVELLNAAGEE
jgi:hypothetical protein